MAEISENRESSVTEEIPELHVQENNDTSDPVVTKTPSVNSASVPTSVSPRQPGKPTATDVGSDYVYISWDQTEDKDVTYYEIKLKPLASGAWSKVSIFTDDDKPVKQILDLDQGTEYEFKVRAHYESEEGPFSDKSDPVLTKSSMAARKPGKPAATDVGNDHIYIVWNEPEDKDVTYYEIKLKQVKDVAWSKISHFTDDDKPVKQIYDLDPATNYEFKVRGHYQDEEGPYSDTSDPVMTKTPTLNSASVPTTVSPRQPGKPTATDVGSDYVYISWDQTEDKDVTYYEIKLKPLGSGAWSKVSIFTNDDKPVMQIRDLDQGTEYEFKVRAHYESEEGPFSDKSDPVLTKSSIAARKPGMPAATDVGNDHIYIVWNEPEDKDVTYYEIKLKQVKDVAWSKISHFTDDGKPVKQIYDLDPATNYEFKVRGHYQDEEGPYSDTSDPVMTKTPSVNSASVPTTVSPRQPGKPTATDVGSDYVYISWDQTEDKDVTYYEIKLKPLASGAWSKVSIFTDDDKPVKQIRDLDQGTEYEFKVRAHYETEEGPFSDKSDPVMTRPPSMNSAPTVSKQPGKPVVTDVGNDYICLSWDKPRDQDVTYYEIQLKSMSNKSWFKISHFTDDTVPYMKISDLNHTTEYEFKVRGHYENEEGPFSDTSDPINTKQLSVTSASVLTTASPHKAGKPATTDVGGDISDPITTTASTDSRQPGKPVATDVGGDYVCITWEKPEHKDVTYYEIKVKQSATEAWSQVSHFTNDGRNYEQISNLVHKTEYEFKVRAHYKNEAGPFSSISDPVVTQILVPIRKPGKPVELDAGVDYVFLSWDKPVLERNVTSYEIKSKELKDSGWTKMPIFTDGNKSLYCVSGLFSSTTYEFKVRSHYGEEEGEFSDKSDPIITLSSEGNEGSSKAHAMSTSGLLGFDTHSRASVKPSKLCAISTESDCIVLSWDMLSDEDVCYYEVKYKTLKETTWGKNTVLTKDTASVQTISGLLQETEYVFKVKAHFEDSESEYSDQSDPIKTSQSSALAVKGFCVKLQDGEPAFYKLPLCENVAARNERFKTRKFEFGSSQHVSERTIMMIGATGSGKSTLIDGMANHLLGVKWEDDFRFIMIDLTAEEEEKKGRQTVSQTNWITSYRLHPKISSVKYILNIIDTPGFGDTRGIERDKELVEQIQAFFTTEGVKGIETIDAICFVTQAPLARLTPTQTYIFDAILSIFGKDMTDNIVAMITFADGKDPPVLNALDQAKVPYCKHYVFNNSALFEPNTEGKCNRFGKMFWEMGFQSCIDFFACVSTLEKRSLQLTAEVLKMREQLNTTIEGLIPQIDVGLQDLATMKAERDLVEKFERQIRDNKNFRYKTTEFHQEKETIKPGQYVTNCTFCHISCHFPCHVRKDEEKHRCSAMKDGVCKVCPKNCSWELHRNNDYRIQVKTVTVEKTYQQMKTKYEFAAKERVSKQKILQSIKRKFVNLKDNVCRNLALVRNYGNYLRQNAIKSNPLTEVEYLDVMLQSEKKEKKPGFQQRIKMLHMIRRQAELAQSAITFDNVDNLLKHMGFDDM
ncbi:twitchin-like [Gigantopelta aegis]|uniref:twitchin-like n=1 Tax=Gigantopelta aegis TaxID=1735272 RepID=UPI001B889881|nr:twitchin-like [Gigantopelta aegis]